MKDEAMEIFSHSKLTLNSEKLVIVFCKAVTLYLCDTISVCRQILLTAKYSGKRQ